MWKARALLPPPGFPDPAPELLGGSSSLHPCPEMAPTPPSHACVQTVGAPAPGTVSACLGEELILLLPPSFPRTYTGPFVYHAQVNATGGGHPSHPELHGPRARAGDRSTALFAETLQSEDGSSNFSGQGGGEQMLEIHSQVKDKATRSWIVERAPGRKRGGRGVRSSCGVARAEAREPCRPRWRAWCCKSANSGR